MLPLNIIVLLELDQPTETRHLEQLLLEIALLLPIEERKQNQEHLRIEVLGMETAEAVPQEEVALPQEEALTALEETVLTEVRLQIPAGLIPVAAAVVQEDLLLAEVVADQDNNYTRTLVF